MGRWKLLEQNFENFTIRGIFYKTNKNAKKFQVLRLQAVIITQWLQMLKSNS